jgi:hypothetical protein
VFRDLDQVIRLREVDLHYITTTVTGREISMRFLKMCRKLSNYTFKPSIKTFKLSRIVEWILSVRFAGLPVKT